jgi:clan AA aspartic protease (TIGR02281 family)
MNLRNHLAISKAVSQTQQTSMQLNAFAQSVNEARRRWLMTAAGSALMLAGCGGNVSIETSLGGPLTAFAARVPMRDNEGHQIVTAQINGKSSQLLLDTGADFNMLTPEAAARLGLKLSETTVPVTGASGEPVPARWTQIEALAVGEAKLAGQLAVVVPVAPEFAYDGVLGTNFFKTLSPRFDYTKGELTLHTANGFVAPGGIAPLPITFVNDRKILVEATVAGITGLYSIDTGKKGALAIFRPSVERYDLRSKLGPGVRMVTGVSVGGRVYGDMVRVPEVSIGSHRLAGVVTELSLSTTALYGSDGWMGNIGAQILQRFTVTIDYLGQRLYLEPNVRLREHFAGPRTGLAYALAAGGVEIIEVVNDSPASISGARVGDLVVSCNDRAVTSADYAHLRAANRGDVGSTMRLGLRDRGGSERSVSVVLREIV